MDKKMTQIFAPLKDAIESRDMGADDIFEIIGNFTVVNPGLAGAMALHARDFIREAQNPDMTYSQLTAEVYRRTYFDPEAMKTYGTDELVNSTPELLQKFVEHLIQSFKMDDLGIAKHAVLGDAPNSH